MARHASPHFAPAPIIDLNPVLYGPWSGDGLARSARSRFASAERQLWERIEETADARLAALGYLPPAAVEPPLPPRADAPQGFMPWLRKITERFQDKGEE